MAAAEAEWDVEVVRGGIEVTRRGEHDAGVGDDEGAVELGELLDGLTHVGVFDVLVVVRVARQGVEDEGSGARQDLVVVADGVGGFEGGMKAHQNAVARRQYFRGVKGPHKEDIHVFMTGDMNSDGAGYGWVFYFGDGTANVGAGVSTRSLSRTGRNLKDYFDRFLEEPEMAQWLEDAEPEGPAKSWSLKMGMWGAKRHGQGVMTVGDAASLVHPISGEGVGYAIESGRLAAAWAHEAHRRKDFSAAILAGYARQLRRHRGREHLSGQALVNLLPNMELMEPLFRSCSKDAAASRQASRSAGRELHRRRAGLQPAQAPLRLRACPAGRRRKPSPDVEDTYDFSASPST